MPRPDNTARNDDIIQMRLAGAKLGDIAFHHTLHVSTVSRIWRVFTRRREIEFKERQLELPLHVSHRP